MMPDKWFTAVLDRSEDESPGIRRFWFRFQELSSYHFDPGQHVILKVPYQGNIDGIPYYFSIASAPVGNNLIELIISRTDEDSGNDFLFDMQPGDTIAASAAQGNFLLPNPIEKPICFICTGSGVAPFRSMIHYIQINGLTRQPVYLIFGTQTFDDLLFEKEFRQLEQSWSLFDYHPVLSRSDVPNGDWLNGYVHEVYERLFRERPAAYFYLCGSKAMTDEARERLEKLGYNKSDVFTEGY